jgi:hypothetical protein
VNACQSVYQSIIFELFLISETLASAALEAEYQREDSFHPRNYSYCSELQGKPIQLTILDLLGYLKNM